MKNVSFRLIKLISGEKHRGLSSWTRNAIYNWQETHYLHLGEGVTVGSLHEDGDGPRVLALLHERKLVLAENVLVDDSGVAEARLVHVLEAVHGLASAGQGQPLHVASLGSAKSQDALLGKHIQGQRVDT